MAKQIKFNFEGTDYTLEYTRRSVQKMERDGFVASDMGSKPVSTLPELFAGAFIAHHPFVKQSVIDAIYERLPDKQQLIGKLSEMYAEPINSLFDEPTEGKRGLDRELVNSSGSDDEAGRDNRPTATCEERFEQAFPYYLAIGMTPAQFWDEDCLLVIAYRKAHRIKQEIQNESLWLQGAYVYEAMCAVAPLYNAWKPRKPRDYPKEPYPLHEDVRNDAESTKEQERKSEIKARDLFEAFAMQFNKSFEGNKSTEKGG